MGNIDLYIRSLYLRNLSKNAFPSNFGRSDDIINQIADGIKQLLVSYEMADQIEIFPIAERLFVDMLANSAFSELADDFAGRYYQPHPNNIDVFRQTALGTDVINQRAQAIGEQRYFADVFNGYAGGNTQEALTAALAISIPASDRIVSISHNQQLLINEPLVALIEDVRVDNEVLEDNVKERLLGQMRAGRELISAGSARAYLVYHTLVRGLIELISRYRGRAIAIAAEKLVELLIENLFTADS